MMLFNVGHKGTKVCKQSSLYHQNTMKENLVFLLLLTVLKDLKAV